MSIRTPVRHHRFAKAKNAATITALITAGWAAQAKAVGTYTLTILGTVATADAYGDGLNNNGQVVGQTIDPTTNISVPFLYSAGMLTTFTGLGGTADVARAINDSGVVVGAGYTAGDKTTHAFLYSNGTLTDLNPQGATESYATSINNLGQVAGQFASPATGGAYHAAIFANGSVTDLGSLDNGLASALALGINASGQVVGESQTGTGSSSSTDHAVLFSGGTIKDLGTFGGDTSVANGINAAGEITGSADTTGDQEGHAFIYQNGVMTDLGTLGGDFSTGQGINSEGDVVSFSAVTDNLYDDATLYEDGTLYDLNNLIPANPNYYLDVATGINDQGQIVGYGDDGNLYSAFLLTPTAVPEPASLSLFVAGAVGLLGRRRRRRRLRQARSYFAEASRAAQLRML
jgi:probable HAF family extracellular repeat protein